MPNESDDLSPIVTDGSVLQLSDQEYNMLLLHSLFETRDYLIEHYDLRDLDGIDQAQLALAVFRMSCQYELDSSISQLTFAEMLDDPVFKQAVENRIESVIS